MQRSKAGNNRQTLYFAFIDAPFDKARDNALGYQVSKTHDLLFTANLNRISIKLAKCPIHTMSRHFANLTVLWAARREVSLLPTSKLLHFGLHL